MHEGNGTSYRVHMSGETKSRLKILHRQANEAGLGHEFVAAFRQIVMRLERYPGVFGEPLYPLPSLKLQVRTGVVIPLAVDYGVHEEKPIVFIRVFRMLSSKAG